MDAEQGLSLFSVLHFYIPLKQKTGGFLLFSEIIEVAIGWKWVK